MSVSYNKIIENFKSCIKIKYDYEIKIDNFTIDDGVFGKYNQKDYAQIEKEKTSIDWIQHLEVYYSDNVFLNEKIMFARYDKDDSEKNGGYIILSNSMLSSFNNSWINDLATQVEDDLGIFLSLFSNFESFPLVNKELSLEYVQNILDIPYDEYQSNHDYDEIKKLFSNIYILKINYEYLELDDENKFKVKNIDEYKYRLLGLIKCNDKINNINKEDYFTEECIKEYLKAFDEEIMNLPYENLYLSLCHNSPKFIFLEIYRMIEKLYKIIFCYNLRLELEITNLKLIDIHDKIEDKFKIKPKEIESLAQIFQYCNKKKSTVEYINNLNIYKQQVDPSNKNTNLDAWIYSIRNNLVHLSFNDNKYVDIKSILDKDIVVKNLIPMIVELYVNLFD